MRDNKIIIMCFIAVLAMLFAVPAAVVGFTDDGNVDGTPDAHVNNYGELEEAIDEITSGGTITLNADINGNGIIVRGEKNFTLDLTITNILSMAKLLVPSGPRPTDSNF